jgi:hypothetical protein
MQDWVFVGWFYPDHGQQIGPVGDDEIRRQFLAGKLKSYDRIWKAWKDTTGQHYFFRSQVRVLVAKTQIPKDQPAKDQPPV